MIGNITKGRRAAGAIRYDFGPGRRDEHLEPRFVAGTVPGTPQQVARLIDHHTRQRPDIKTPIWRVSLSVPDEDGELDDLKWGEIATKYVQRMGFGGCPWVAARHGHDHVHLTVSRLGWDGRLADDGRDWLRNRTVLDGIEAEYGLVRAADRFRETPGVRSGAELAAAQRRGADRPEREQIRQLAQAARDAAAGLGREAFEAELTARGVDHRANVASTGRMNGYSLSLPSWLDSDGEQIWIPASKAGRELAWGRLGPVVERREPPASTAPPADPAAQLLATVRAARAAEEDQAVEDVVLPPYLAPELRIDRRRHGWLTAHQLLTARADAAKAVRDRVDDLNAETATAMRFDGIAAGVATGAHVAELHERRDRLQRAVGHLADATAHQAQADEHTAAATASRAVAEEATKKAGRSKLVLAALGTTRAAEQGMARAAVEFAEQQERAAAHCAQAAALATARAREAAPDDAQEAPVAALERLTADWAQLERAARR
ncbi:hypothetical protein PUR71_00940, partial [Streptomyces sp. SP17BM10]|uniref:relaxase/mobilization nuclease domain-containing protein n=1 Tax=Streptomyces sp. SP17BM10 TaxID=3002530 RepID=UPI002E78E0A7